MKDRYLTGLELIKTVMESSNELNDPIFDDLSEQYNKLISDIDKLQERYNTLCQYKEELSEDLNLLFSDLSNLTESVLQTQRKGKVQADITANAANETTRLLKELLEEDYVMDMLNYDEDFLDIPTEKGMNM